MTDQEICKEIRKEITVTACSASIAHIASAFSVVELLYVLYLKDILNIDPNKPDDKDRDIFILSKGHASLALYDVLYRKGFFDRETLMSFCKPGSILGGEPVPSIPGVETVTGSLGHGLGYGAGVALGNKLSGRDSKVYVMVGDGECEEGTVWESLMFIAKQKLTNLITILDNNKIQKMGSVEDIAGITNWKERFEAFGFEVREIDGHNIEEIEAAYRKPVNDKPVVIIANTVKGKGVSVVENDPRWHFRLPNKKELKVFAAELNMSEEEVELCRKRT